MESQKKCPTCGEWSEWSMSADDVCKHCQNLLMLQVQKSENYSEPKNNILTMAKKELKAEYDFFEPKTGDSIIMSFIRKTAWYVHFLFVLLLLFMIWVGIVVAA